MFAVLKSILYQVLFEMISVRILLIKTITVVINGLKRNASANVDAEDTDSADISVPIGTMTGNLSEMRIERDKTIDNTISCLLNITLNLKEVYKKKLIKSAINKKINTLTLFGNCCTSNYIKNTVIFKILLKTFYCFISFLNPSQICQDC
jgi:hypothetical protein